MGIRNLLVDVVGAVEPVGPDIEVGRVEFRLGTVKDGGEDDNNFK